VKVALVVALRKEKYTLMPTQKKGGGKKEIGRERDYHFFNTLKEGETQSSAKWRNPTGQRV